jgi:plasmid stability protein
MATLVAREVENELVAALKERAGRHGRSAEADHRAILEEVPKPRCTTQDLIEAVRRMDRLADLDAGELRDADDLGREFDFDPVHGTTMRYVRRAP